MSVAQRGKELFFRSFAGQFMAVPIAPGETFDWGEPKTLFPVTEYRQADNGRMCDVAPGDQRFFMLKLMPSETPSEMIVVENFFQELRAKARP